MHYLKLLNLLFITLRGAAFGESWVYDSDIIENSRILSS